MCKPQTLCGHFFHLQLLDTVEPQQPTAEVEVLFGSLRGAVQVTLTGNRFIHSQSYKYSNTM